MGFRCRCPIQDSEGDSPLGEVISQLGELTGGSPEPGQLGDDEGVALTEGPEEFVPLRPRSALFPDPTS